MRFRRVMPLAFAAIVVAGCSGAATAPSAAAPTTAPAAATPAPTPESVASATAAPTPEPVASATAAPSAVAGCLDKAVHAVLYKGLKDPDSLTAEDEAVLQAGLEAWEPVGDNKDRREWFLDGEASLDGTTGMRAKVGDALTLRSGQVVIEACP